MRSLQIFLTTLFLAILSLVVSGAPLSNNDVNSHEELHKLEARYDTLSSLKYSNAYIAAEKRVIEAKIEKIKRNAVSSDRKGSEIMSSENNSSQNGDSSISFDITGPQNLQEKSGYEAVWIVKSSAYFDTNFDTNGLKHRIGHVACFGKEKHYPSVMFSITSWGDKSLHSISLNTRNQEKDYDGFISFNDETIPVRLRIINAMQEDFKNHAELAGIAFLRIIINESNGAGLYKALQRKTLRSMTIGDVVVPLDGFTESKALFSALLNKLSTKISEMENF